MGICIFGAIYIISTFFLLIFIFLLRNLTQASALKQRESLPGRTAHMLNIYTEWQWHLTSGFLWQKSVPFSCDPYLFVLTSWGKHNTLDQNWMRSEFLILSPENTDLNLIHLRRWMCFKGRILKNYKCCYSCFYLSIVQCMKCCLNTCINLVFFFFFSKNLIIQGEWQ